jgi:hypothetical protein
MIVGGAAFAQAPFTIVYPPDGTKVREKLNVRFPNNSMPPNSYVGIFLNGKLIEAAKPTYVVPKNAKGKPAGRPYYQYVLDVKGRGIADTKGEPIELKAVLFTEVNDEPRIVDQSSVRITVDKSAGITVPNNGLLLRYGFKPGTEISYKVQERAAISQITESQAKLGGKPAELPIEGRSLRMLYAFDNVVSTPNGLQYIVRMQALSEKGKNYADLQVASDNEVKRYMDYEMAPIYMQMTGTGLQVWGSIPPYISFEGTTGEGSRLDLFASLPLPTLPEKRVRPGDSWQARFQDGVIDLEKLYDVTSVVRTTPGRGEFVGVEWERGRRCAVIRNIIEVGTASLESRGLARAGVQEDERRSLNETIWFDLDRKVIVKIIREQTIDTTQDIGRVTGFGSGGASGSAGPSAGGPGVGAPGAGGPPPGFGGPGGGGQGDDNKAITPGSLSDILRQIRPGGGGRGGRGGGQTGPGGFGQGGFPGAPGAPGGFGGGQGRIGQLNAQDKILTRVRLQRIFTLE